MFDVPAPIIHFIASHFLLLVAALVVMLAAWMIYSRLHQAAGMHAGKRDVIDQKRHANRRNSNRIVMSIDRAGKRLSPFALLRHVGRRTSMNHVTPVRLVHDGDTLLARGRGKWEKEMSYESIRVERKGYITTVTIHRPEVMNALHPPASKEMDDAFNDFAADPEAWVAILTGAGDKAFSAGNDLKWQAQHGGEALHEAMQGLKGGLGGIAMRFDLFKPLIAAVNGLALGGGFECALACDIIIASEKASFGLPEPTVGMIAGAGGVHYLPCALPFHQAMGMLLTARRIWAQEALQMGLVNQVVPLEQWMPTAVPWAERILVRSPLAIRTSKEAPVQGLGMRFQQAARTRFPGQTALYQSEDFVEGPRAFAEERKPQWQGR